MRRFEVNSRKPCGQSDRCEVIGSGSAPASFHSHFSEESSVIVWGGFQWRAGDSWGSSRFLGLRSRAEVRIPAPEGVLPLLVEHAGSYLQEEMRSTLAPIPSVVSSPFACSLL